MLSDRYEQELAQILKTGLPAPGPDCEARALAALADIHPRRHPNLLTYIIVAALLLLLAAGVFAAVRYFYVEGMLHFHDVSHNRRDEIQEVAGRFFSGELEWETDRQPTLGGDVSPVSGEVISTGNVDKWWPTRMDLLLSRADGSDQVNLTEAAGIGGVNCDPKWSPDGTMIAFQHYDPVEGIYPCDGFQVWVMSADGADAHRVMPQIALPHWKPTWSPDGSRLLTYMYDKLPSGEGVGAISTDIWGEDIRMMPNVGDDASWSPDGSMIISVQRDAGRVDGTSGRWNQLLLTNADGSDPRVLVEQFVADDDCRDHLPDEADLAGYQEIDHTGGVQTWAGPLHPVWSPDGDKIAFLAALPFDPDGLFYKNQVEVWVYDLANDELIRVTDDDVGQKSIIWK
jgi:dipeptidyl aminopeptidase/acylaminoacyl peptidase